MTKLFPAQRSVAMSPRGGLTLLEVIFAMMVLLVGLVSVGLLIPLAGRQAADSYQITQGLAAGESTIAMINAADIIQPTIKSPWCLRDDPAGFSYRVETLKDAYGLLGLSLSIPGNESVAFANQNRASGYGFCLDPLFWGNQQASVTDPLPDPFVRSRFPCLDEAYNPVYIGETSSPPTDVPRLIRVSVWNPSKVPTPGVQRADGYLSGPAASRLATLEGGDLVQLSPDVNKALGPLRLIYSSASTGALLKGAVAAETPSWLMTLTPAINTPMLPQSETKKNFDGLPGIPATEESNRPVRIPAIYDAAVVVFSKRDVRDINPNMSATAQNFPTSERILRVSEIAPEATTSGSFNITLQGSIYVEPRIKIGDWLMLSRWTQETLPPHTPSLPSSLIARQIHRWYRVVSITDEQLISAPPQPLIQRTVRVVGSPWNWSENELVTWIDLTGSIPPGPPGPGITVPPGMPPFEVHATLLKDVVHVYEREIELQ